jgi:hypothetical protein
MCDVPTSKRRALILIAVVGLALNLAGAGTSADTPAPVEPMRLRVYSAIGPYKGQVLKGVDTSTLSNKIMCGYQGWFGTPGDGGPAHGWQHWTKHFGPMADGNAKVDFWPDVSELSDGEKFTTEFKLPDGKPAQVFSSIQKPTVLRHFHWMQQYGIDGAFVQRFASVLSNNGNLARCNAVLANCREGANTSGRAYAVMYDLSGLGEGETDIVMNDWRALRSKMAMTDDPAYLRHNGKPLVALWGIGFNDNRRYTIADCEKLIQFFKNDPEAGGCTVMVGVPAHWRELKGDAVTDPKLLDIIAKADIVSPWTVGRYSNPEEASRYAHRLLQPDAAWCHEHHLDYLPVVFPGFSWHNMYGGPFNQIPRLKGEFLWTQLCEARRAGASMIYVAMFDEVDEGTAIFKCANDVPEGSSSKFVTLEGLPSDYYLKLVGAGGKLLRGELSDETSDKLPDQILH